MDEKKRQFIDNAIAQNKSIRLTLPKSRDHKWKGFGFYELVTDDAHEVSIFKHDSLFLRFSFL